MTTPAPAPAPAPTPAPAPAAAPTAAPPAPSPAPAPASSGEPGPVPYGRFAQKVEQAREASAEADLLRTQLATAQEQIASLESKVVRADVRVATGVDDDAIADVLHRRYQSEVEGAEAPPALADWWSGIVSDEAKRAALPRGLQAYAIPAAAPPPAPPPPRPGTRVPGGQAPPPGRQEITRADLARMTPAEKQAAAVAFFSGGRRFV
jgi:hypothetical protein